ncbi:MAG TPA: hypothetical protein VK306_14995 [Acidimicrobiales bacterium]|nr:hypothetical protein [Acidimicrobiales bacterium]
MPADPDPTDEFALLNGDAAEFGITWTGPPGVERRDALVGDGSVASALAGGQDPAELALLHGAGLEAHRDATAPAELALPRGAGLEAHRDAIAPAELALPRGAGLNAHTWAASAPVEPAAGIAAFAGA